MQTQLIEVGVVECIISASRLVLPVLVDYCGYSRVPALKVYLCLVKRTFHNLLKMTAKYLYEIEESVLNKIRASFKL